MNRRFVEAQRLFASPSVPHRGAAEAVTQWNERANTTLSAERRGRRQPRGPWRCCMARCSTPRRKSTAHRRRRQFMPRRVACLPGCIEAGAHAEPQFGWRLHRSRRVERDAGIARASEPPARCRRRENDGMNSATVPARHRARRVRDHLASRMSRREGEALRDADRVSFRPCPPPLDSAMGA